MRTTSENYKKAQGYGFSLRLEASLNGTQKSLTYDNLLSFKLSGNGSSDEALSFGYVSAFEISFSIDNIDGRWDNTSFKDVEWTLFMGKNLSWTESEEVQIGIFKTQEALISDGAINIKATDNMSKFESKFKGINYPCTVHDIILQCCKQCNVVFKEGKHPNMDVVLDGAYQLTQISCRTVLSLAAEICGSFAIINSYGELEFRWFDTKTIVAEYNADDISDFKPGQDEVIVGGTSVSFNGRIHSYGSGSEKINLTGDNRLMMYFSDEKIHDILEKLYQERESTLIYHEGSFSTVGEPALEVGDVISVKSKNGISYKILVSGFILSNNLKMEVTSPPIGKEDILTISATESGSIPRETSESIGSEIARNEAALLTAGATLDDFLQLRFSAESGSDPVAFITLVGNCTTEGLITINLILNSILYIEMKDRVLVGPYVKTMIIPIQDVVSGNNTISLQLISDETVEVMFMEEERPTAGSVLVLQGRNLGTATSCDGLISVGDSFKRYKASQPATKVGFREALNDIPMTDYSGTILCQTVQVKLTRQGAKLSFEESNDSIILT